MQCANPEHPQSYATEEGDLPVLATEKERWADATTKYAALKEGAEATSTDLLADGMTLDEFLLLAAEGGFSYASDWHPFSFSAEPKEHRIDTLFNSAMVRGKIRRQEWVPTWHESGDDDEPSDVICRVLGDEHGHLSGTITLLKGPQDVVAQVYFPPGKGPRVVVVYQPKERVS